MKRNGLHFWNQRGRINQDRVSKINLGKKIFGCMVNLYREKSQHLPPLKSPKLEFPPGDFGGFWICCSAHFYLNFGTKKPCVAIFSGSNRNCPGLDAHILASEGFGN